MADYLPEEIKTKLTHLPDSDIVRLQTLIARGQTSALSPDKETAPFLVYLLGDSLEEVAQKTGHPKDVIYLTFLKYNWLEKRQEVDKQGRQQLIIALQKQLVDNVLLATHKTVIAQVMRVYSGEIPPDRCPMIPKNIHALGTLLKMCQEVHNLVDKIQKDNTGNIIHAENVQINQQVAQLQSEAAEGVIRMSKAERLAQLAAKKE